jgi:hypothetical protein
MTTYRQSWRQRTLNIYILKIFAISCAKNMSVLYGKQLSYLTDNGYRAVFTFCKLWRKNSFLRQLFFGCCSAHTAIAQFLHFVNCDARTLFSRQLFSCCSARSYSLYRETLLGGQACSDCSWGRFDTGKQGASRHPRIDRTAEQPFTASLPAFFDSLRDIEESAWHRLYGILPDSLRKTPGQPATLLYTVKKVINFTVSSRDVTNQTLPGRE